MSSYMMPDIFSQRIPVEIEIHRDQTLTEQTIRKNGGLRAENRTDPFDSKVVYTNFEGNCLSMEIRDLRHEGNKKRE